MADPPFWSSAIDAGAKVFTATAVVVGAAVGYFRYLRGRLFHAKLDLELEAEFTTIQGGQALMLLATVKNDGTCLIGFPASSSQEIQVAVCYSPAWTKAKGESQPPAWNTALYYVDTLCSSGSDRLLDHLEPGQRFVRRTLVPPPVAGTPLAYRVRLVIQGSPRPLFRYKKPMDWSTERVLSVGDAVKEESSG